MVMEAKNTKFGCMNRFFEGSKYSHFLGGTLTFPRTPSGRVGVRHPFPWVDDDIIIYLSTFGQKILFDSTEYINFIDMINLTILNGTKNLDKFSIIDTGLQTLAIVSSFSSLHSDFQRFRERNAGDLVGCLGF